MPCRQPTTNATTNATTNPPSAGHGVISMPENDNEPFFLLLNLTVPWGLLTKNATTNLTSAGHGAISMPRKLQ